MTLTLTGTDDQGHAISTSTTTDGTGAYSFTGLWPSNPSGYTVTETQPAAYGHKGVIPGIGGTPGDHTITQILGSGANSTANNFAEVLGSLAGTVYYDANGDGRNDSGDSPLGGVTLTLTGPDVNGHTVTLTATTASDGTYSFGGLAAGPYQLVETQPTSYGHGRARHRERIDSDPALGYLGHRLGDHPARWLQRHRIQLRRDAGFDLGAGVQRRQRQRHARRGRGGDRRRLGDADGAERVDDDPGCGERDVQLRRSAAWDVHGDRDDAVGGVRATGATIDRRRGRR